MRASARSFFQRLLAVAHLEEVVGKRLRPEDGDIAHRVDADGDHGLRPAAADAFVRFGHRLETAGTVAVDGVCHAVLGNAGPQRDDAGDVGRVGGSDVARNDLVDRRRIEIEAFEQLADDDPAQFLRMERD